MDVLGGTPDGAARRGQPAAAQAVREASSAQGAAARQSPGKRAKMEGVRSGAGGGNRGGSSTRVPECRRGEGLGPLSWEAASPQQQHSEAASVCGDVRAGLQRFYLRNSVMDYHPRDLMYTVLWVACKVEHYPALSAARKGRVDSSKDSLRRQGVRYACGDTGRANGHRRPYSLGTSAFAVS